MPTIPKVSVLDYYDLTPPSDHAAGDIWSGLPSHGMVGGERISGIVITPACDLSNRKVATITYLPIIPVASLFVMPSYLPEIQRAIDGQLQVVQLGGLIRCPERFLPPEEADLLAAQHALESALADPKMSRKEKDAIRRALAGTKLLAAVRGGSEESTSPLMQLLFGRDFPTMVRSIVTNAGPPHDVHFLPPDEQPLSWSGVPVPSVALFRFALSAPVTVFDLAQDIQQKDWQASVTRVAAVTPGARVFLAERPLKRVRLRPRFFADLITRYVGTHVRLGSPDFSPDSVTGFVENIVTGTQ